MTITIALLIMATFAAAAIDVKKRRIPNALTGTFAFIGIALHVPLGLHPTLLAVAAMLVAFIAGSFAFSAGWLGGGDIKLISACCALVGFPGSLGLVLEILVAGAFLSLVTATLHGRLLALVRSTIVVMYHGTPEEPVDSLPYGVAIAAGSLTYALSTTVPGLRLPL
jgi:prepilin peptidase CpaA